MTDERSVRAAWSAGGLEMNTYWKGYRILKNPVDLWMVQELIHETKPEVLVETGTKYGGSACFYADLGVEVWTVDVAPPKPGYPHDGVHYLTGWSTAPKNLVEIELATAGRRTMVVLDSDHRKSNVLAELEAYAGFVSSGCYLIVEDTLLGRLPEVAMDWAEYMGDGPADALEAWLPDHPEFVVDRSWEKWGLSQHPGGWLRRL